jgi:hypothetical protein
VKEKEPYYNHILKHCCYILTFKESPLKGQESRRNST